MHDDISIITEIHSQGGTEEARLLFGLARRALLLLYYYSGRNATGGALERLMLQCKTRVGNTD